MHAKIRLDQNRHFEKAVRFADAGTRKRLLKYQEQTLEAAREQEKLEQLKRQQRAQTEATTQAQLIYQIDAALDIPVESDIMRRIKISMLEELRDKLIKLDRRPEVLEYITLCTDELAKLKPYL